MEIMLDNGNGCNDHWCDYYGKGSEKCDRCEKKQTSQDKTDLKVVLKRRVYHLTEVDRLANKKFGQER
jgi:hypothetical protein